MSLIVLPGACQEKTFYVTDVQRYCKTKVDSIFDPLLAAAMVLKSAIKLGCSEICIEVDGHRPRRYKTSYIEDKCRQDRRYHCYLPRPASLIERLMERYTAQYGSLIIDPGT